MDRKAIVNRLDVISSKARQLSQDIDKGSLWPGQLSKGLDDIDEQLKQLQRDTSEDRHEH